MDRYGTKWLLIIGMAIFGIGGWTHQLDAERRLLTFDRGDQLFTRHVRCPLRNFRRRKIKVGT